MTGVAGAGSPPQSPIRGRTPCASELSLPSDAAVPPRASMSRSAYRTAPHRCRRDPTIEERHRDQGGLPLVYAIDREGKARLRVVRTGDAPDGAMQIVLLSGVNVWRSAGQTNRRPACAPAQIMARHSRAVRTHNKKGSPCQTSTAKKPRAPSSDLAGKTAAHSSIRPCRCCFLAMLAMGIPRPDGHAAPGRPQISVPMVDIMLLPGASAGAGRRDDGRSRSDAS